MGLTVHGTPLSFPACFGCMSVASRWSFADDRTLKRGLRTCRSTQRGVLGKRRSGVRGLSNPARYRYTLQIGGKTRYRAWLFACPCDGSAACGRDTRQDWPRSCLCDTGSSRVTCSGNMSLPALPQRVRQPLWRNTRSYERLSMSVCVAKQDGSTQMTLR